MTKNENAETLVGKGATLHEPGNVGCSTTRIVRVVHASRDPSVLLSEAKDGAQSSVRG